MLRETGVVTRLGGGFAWIASAGQQDCARCAAGKGCGGGILGRLLGERLYLVRAVAGNVPLSVGDRVVFGVAPAALMRGSALAYGLPLAGLLSGAALLAQRGEGWAILGALAGLLCGVAAGRFGARAMTRDGRLQPLIIEKLPADAAAPACLRQQQTAGGTGVGS